MGRLIFYLLALLFIFPQAAFPASAWRAVSFEENFPWRSGLSVHFDADENLCRKAYGKEWQIKCSAPLGQYGQWARGVKMTPEAAGHWEWDTPNSLVFVPESASSLRPDTAYTIDLSGLPLPANIAFDRLQGHIRTLPPALRLLDGKFRIDPAPQGTHRITASFELNYAAPTASPAVQLDLPAGAVAGKPEIILNPQRDKLNIAWPVHKLPDYHGQCRIDFPEYGQIVLEELVRFQPQAQFLIDLPGSASLFRVTSASLSTESDKALNRRHILEIHTSLHATPQAVAEALKIWELPLYNGKASTLPYDWLTAPDLPSDLFKQARPLKPISLAESNDNQGKFRFQIPAANGRYIAVMLEDLKAANGQRLSKPYARILRAEPESGQVAFLQPGNILPESGRVAFYATDLEAVAWEVQLLNDEYLALFALASDNPIKEPLNRVGLPLDSLSRRRSGVIALANEGEGKAQHASLDLSGIISEISGSPSGIAILTLSGMKNGHKISAAQKVIIAANLGLIVKKDASGRLHCFVHDLRTGAPCSGAQFTVLGMNGLPVHSVRGDKEGHAVFPSLSGLAREKKPVAIVCRKDADMAWMPLENRQRELDLVNYVKGSNHAGPDSLLAFVFTQRGLYRPGDTLHFGCMPRFGNFAAVKPGLPLYAELLDPRGKVVWKSAFKAGEGLAELNWPSPPDSLSGTYTLNVKNGARSQILGTCAVKMEQFRPDSMRMKLDVPSAAGWITADNIPKISARLSSLYGMPAQNRLVHASIQTSPCRFSFGKYPGWIFTDPAPFLGAGQKRPLASARTDASGKCALLLPADLFGSSSAMLTLHAEGFDAAGGKTASGSASFLVSPATRVIGYRFGGAITNPGFIELGTDVEIEFIAINSDLAQIAQPDLQFSLLRRIPVTSLVSDGQGGYRYDEAPHDEPIRTWRDYIPANGKTLKLPVEAPGSYALLARDEGGQILANIPFKVAGNSLQEEDEPLAPSKMRLAVNKYEYTPGEEIHVSFTLPYDAFGLFTIEREGIHAWKWIKGHAGENEAVIAIPPQFEGQGHLVGAFTRAADSSAIYMTPLAYAAAPFMANMGRKNMGLKIEAPAASMPGHSLTVRVSADQPGKALVFAVDEGILQLTSFACPDPLQELLGNRALDVTTWQTADLLMPSYGLLSKRISAYGGGADSAPFGAHLQNPFKRRHEPPVVFWSGIVDVSREPLEMAVPVPSWYAGKIRIMAVGASTETAGNAVAVCSIAGPVSILPHLPLALAPGDECTGAVILSNNTAVPQQAKLLVEAQAMSFHGLPAQEILLAPGQELAVPLHLSASFNPVVGKIKAILESPDYRLERLTEISIRPASPLATTLQTGFGNELPANPSLYPYKANYELQLSSVPLPLVAGLARYLETYPYGCTEQLTSRAFAQTILDKWHPASSKAKESLLEGAQQAIRARFDDSAGVALWQGAQPDLLLTAYAADYLLYRRESALPCDISLLNSICDTLSWNTALKEPNLASARASAYAIWVLAREGRIVTQLLEELAAALESRGVKGWENDLTGVLMNAAMKEMNMNVRLEPQKIKFARDGWFDEYAQAALLTTILARYYPEELTPAYRENFIKWSLAVINRNNFSTFSGCQGARALAALGGDRCNIMPTPRCADGSALDVKNGELFIQASTQSCRKFILENQSTPLYWQIVSTGYAKTQDTAGNVESGISISREFLNEDGQAIQKAALGDVVEVKIRVSAAGERPRDCVITDLLPGGLEFIIPESHKLPTGVKALDRQEDRLLLFADVSSEPLEFRYKTRAAITGKFQIPGIAAEDMYDRAIYGRGPGGTLIIEKNENF